MAVSTIVTLSGALCLLLSGFTLYKTLPREGRPDTWWTGTEMRAVSTAMLVLFLFLGGLTMLVTGIFSRQPM